MPLKIKKKEFVTKIDFHDTRRGIFIITFGIIMGIIIYILPFLSKNIAILEEVYLTISLYENALSSWKTAVMIILNSIPALIISLGIYFIIKKNTFTLDDQHCFIGFKRNKVWFDDIKELDLREFKKFGSGKPTYGIMCNLKDDSEILVTPLFSKINEIDEIVGFFKSKGFYVRTDAEQHDLIDEEKSLNDYVFE